MFYGITTLSMKVSAADITLLSLLDCITAAAPAAIAPYPSLAHFQQTMKIIPEIKAFCESGKRF